VEKQITSDERETQKEKRRKEVEENLSMLEQFYLSREDLLKFTAESMADVTELIDENHRLVRLLNASDMVNRIVRSYSIHPSVRKAILDKMAAEMKNPTANAFLEGMQAFKSEGARNAATKRHAHNRATADRIASWYFDNHKSFRSLDAAAEAVTRIEHVAFRTARKHIGEAAKKLRSTRKE
jgi:hypothetical protein